MNPQHVALLTLHAKQKICQMIVQSRVAFPASEPRSTNKWFNLGTDDLSSLKSQVWKLPLMQCTRLFPLQAPTD